MSLADLPTYIPLHKAAEQYALPVEVLAQAAADNTVKTILVHHTLAVAVADLPIVVAQVDGDELVSFNEVARRLNIDSRTISRWHEYGWLPALASGPRRAKLVSWRRAQALGKRHEEAAHQGSRLIPRGQEVTDVLTP